jgi:hypothetical protein
MAEVVMDDMAIGNPVSPWPSVGACEPQFPGIHIAQFPFQVIGNCGLIFLMQCSNRHRRNTGIGDPFFEAAAFWAGTASTIVGWRCTQYDGIVAAADAGWLGVARG